MQIPEVLQFRAAAGSVDSITGRGSAAFHLAPGPCGRRALVAMAMAGAKLAHYLLVVTVDL